MSLRGLAGLGSVVLTLAACGEMPTQQEAVDSTLLTAALSGGVVDKASGSGHFDDFRFPDPDFRSFAFNAKAKADGGTSGQFELHSRNFPVRIHGEIECIAVSGNEAWFAGPTTDSDDDAQVGVIRAFRVVDNGEGAGAAADEISFAVPVGSAQAWCDAMVAFTTHPIEQGNVQVH